MNLNRLAGVLALNWLVTSWAGAITPGYLPVIGPSPIRFQTEARAAPRVSLPPLQTGVEAKPVDAGEAHDKPPVTNVLATNAGPATAAVATNADSSSAGVAAAPLPVPTLVAPPAAPTVVTPQMFLPFFTQAPGATNAPTATVVLPAGLNFTPPVPTPPSSSATYVTP